MSRKIEVEYNDLEKTKKFVEKNWRIALVIAGAAGAVGEAIWLTARYLREKRKRDINHESALRMIEDEVEASKGKTAVVLETGTYLGQIAGEEGEVAMSELSSQMEEGEAKEALEVLKSVITANRKK